MDNPNTPQKKPDKNGTHKGYPSTHPSGGPSGGPSSARAPSLALPLGKQEESYNPVVAGADGAAGQGGLRHRFADGWDKPKHLPPILEILVDELGRAEWMDIHGDKWSRTEGVLQNDSERRRKREAERAG